MIVLTQGQPTGTPDLAILVRDASGNLVDPVNISYTIYKLKDLVPTKPTVAYEYDLHQPLNMEGGPSGADSGPRQPRHLLRPVHHPDHLEGRLQDRLAASGVSRQLPAELRPHGLHRADHRPG
jgi:hypothetical protein